MDTLLFTFFKIIKNVYKWYMRKKNFQTNEYFFPIHTKKIQTKKCQYVRKYSSSFSRKAYQLHRQLYFLYSEKKPLNYSKILRHSFFRGVPGMFILTVLFLFSLKTPLKYRGKLFRKNFEFLCFRALKFSLPSASYQYMHFSSRFTQPFFNVL